MSGTAYLSLYVGTPEESAEDFLYLDMVFPHRTIPLYVSKESLNDCSAEDYLEFLEQGFNEANLITKFTGLQLKVDFEGILETTEEMDERISRNVRQLLKELE